jgi:translation initiation factor 2B subunit (eIF-2B alpha/beta/delta family)
MPRIVKKIKKFYSDSEEISINRSIWTDIEKRVSLHKLKPFFVSLYNLINFWLNTINDSKKKNKNKTDARPTDSIQRSKASHLEALC